MTAINFPDTPTSGDTFTVSDITWEWTGTVWKSATATGQSLPLAHADTHEDGGTDEITIAQSQVTNLSTDLTAKAPIESPTFTGTVTGTPVLPSSGDTNAASLIGYIGIPFGVNGTTGTYTVDYEDAGRLIHSTSSRTITLPSYFMGEDIQPGTTVVFSTASGVTVTLTGSLSRVGDGNTGNRTLSPFGLATAVYINDSVGW